MSDVQTSAPTSGEKPKRQQTLQSRFAWFLAGAVVNYLFISTPFKYLQAHTELSLASISACSIGISTTFFFIWNYFFNFRGESRKRDALRRYVIAVILMWAVQSTVLTLLKHWDFRLGLSIGKFPIDLDIVATQVFIGGFKFFLYHRWVFPLAKK